MTPIEIIEAYDRGDRLEYAPGAPTDTWQDIASIGLIINAQSQSCTYYGKSDISWIRIKRETFGFFKAINTMREGNIIGKDDLPNRLFRIVTYSKGWQLQTKNMSDTIPKWSELCGYPLDWPDSQDFYEVE